MNWRTFWKSGQTAIAILFLMFLLSGMCLAQSRTSQPNFVIIFADDMGYGDAGCYGHPTIKTPNLDQMAAEGMRFTQFYSANSVCSASRASLLTGRLPKRCGTTGVYWPHTAEGLSKNEITVANILKQKGYATTCIGKWHLGHRDGYAPTSRGFDSYYGVPYSNDMWIDPEIKLADDIVLREGVTVEKIRSDAYKKHKPHYVPLMQDDEVIEFPADQTTLTKRYTEQAIAFIRSHQNEPFFLYLPHTMPHIPLYASKSFKDKSMRGLYGDVIEELDWSVGQILTTLKETGLDQNTLVIFTSDNGPWLSKKFDGGSAGLLRGGKFTTWEGGHREPAIAWWPGTVPAATVNRGIASTLDILPTLADFAGAKIPSDRVMDGYSLCELITKNSKSPRQVMYYYRNGKLRAVRMGKWKLHYESTGSNTFKYATHESPVLYNIDCDPGEHYDVADQNPAVVAEIQKVVDAHNRTFDEKTGD